MTTHEERHAINQGTAEIARLRDESRGATMTHDELRKACTLNVPEPEVDILPEDFIDNTNAWLKQYKAQIADLKAELARRTGLQARIEELERMLHQAGKEGLAIGGCACVGPDAICVFHAALAGKTGPDYSIDA
jgi:hypothetical protein